MTEVNREIFTIHINGTIDAVWHEITKQGEPQQCFFNMQMHTPEKEPVPGSTLHMRSKSGKYTGAIGKILEFDPPRRFSHTFKFTHLDDPECIVTYELEEAAAAEGGVEFRMILDNLPEGTKTAKQMKQGGTMIINTLKAMVENGKPSFGTRMLYMLFRLLEPLSPKKSLTSNWPL